MTKEIEYEPGVRRLVNANGDERWQPFYQRGNWKYYKWHAGYGYKWTSACMRRPKGYRSKRRALAKARWKCVMLASNDAATEKHANRQFKVDWEDENSQ